MDKDINYKLVEKNTGSIVCKVDKIMQKVKSVIRVHISVIYLHSLYYYLSIFAELKN